MNKAAAPMLSVLMGVYNGERYLAEAIDSILAQTTRDFEFVIVNDGSTDGTASLLAAYESRDPRIRVIVQSNRGLAAALNVGLNVAKGTFIARMDADDRAVPERLAKQLAAFEANPQLVLLGARVEMTSCDGIELGSRGTIRGHDNIRQRLLMGQGDALMHPVVMYRRQTALDVGGYDERFSTSSDLDLYLRLSEAGLVDNLPDMLLYWRQHKDSTIRTISFTWRDTKALAIEKTLERIGSRQFARELFAAEPAYRFPENRFDLGEFAMRNERNRAAGILFWQALMQGPNRAATLGRLLQIMFRTLYRRTAQPFS